MPKKKVVVPEEPKPIAGNKLREFYNDKAMMTAWAEFMALQLKEIAVERVFTKEDVSSLPDAQEVVTRSFAALKKMFDTEPRRTVENRGV